MSCAATHSETAGAFFDIDGTLLPAPSLEWRFIGYLLERNEISSGHRVRWLARFATTFWHDPHGATLGNKLFLRRLSETLVNDWEKSLTPVSSRVDSLPFFDEALRRIAWHRAQGHRVFLVSGTLAPLARVLARGLAACISADIEVCGTELAVVPGSERVWSGEIAGEHVSGGAKLRAVQVIAGRYGLDLARSYAYGDSAADLQMLDAVGHSIAVNPARRLAREARKRGWQTCAWQKTLGEISNAAARQLASKAIR
ncbi:MAG: HAD family phosphatase [Candidatus Acidiferrales bacterium]|jgi:HAD superfamily hydrolase (TIGR01490 family)